MSNLKMPSAELRDIERLVRDIARTGPVVSLYLGLDDRADPNRILLRWRQQRTLLEQRGARPEDLQALEEEVASATFHPGRRALAAFATEGRAHLSWLLERASIEDSSTVGPLPALVPLLSWEQRRTTYLIALADHTGVDLTVGVWPNHDVEIRRVEGTDDEVTPHQSGGWAALAMTRYQRRVLDSWQHNAREAAQAIVEEADAHQVDVIALTGDLRSVQLLRSALPERLTGLVEVMPVGGTRGQAGASPRLQADLDAVITSRAAKRDRALLDRWHDLRGAAHRSVEGAIATSRALEEEAVETLLIGAHSVPRANVKVRDALGSGATVHVLPDPLAGGLIDRVGAILRHGVTVQRPNG